MTYSSLKEIVEKHGCIFYDHEDSYEIQNCLGTMIARFYKSADSFTITRDMYDSIVPSEVFIAIKKYVVTPVEERIDTDDPCNISNAIVDMASDLGDINLPLIRNWKIKDQHHFYEMLRLAKSFAAQNNEYSTD